MGRIEESRSAFNILTVNQKGNKPLENLVYMGAGIRMDLK